MKTLVRLYMLLVRAASSLQWVFLLAIRLYWGWQFAITGWGKLGNLEGVTRFFTSLGIPAPGPTAHFIAVTEFAGGILLALGLGSRLISLQFVCNLLVAYWTADREAFLSLFSAPEKFWQATPYTFLFAALIILIFGPGKASLDALLAKRFQARP